MKNYPWYKIIGKLEGLSQGDFIHSCPIIEPIKDLDKEVISANYTEYNVLIMSQSCDLINKKLELVLVCPFWELSEIEKKYPWFASNRNKEKLRRGNQPNYHLLNKCKLQKFKSDFLIVDFRSVFSVPYDILIDYVNKADERLRLLSPYKEHLSQAFARFFMRVGLPINIKKFKM
ncbi:MAG: hypothetical protein ACTSWY_01280 [Promethearchaeota archaeon]